MNNTFSFRRPQVKNYDGVDEFNKQKGLQLQILMLVDFQNENAS
jgi:hypothetical protein